MDDLWDIIVLSFKLAVVVPIIVVPIVYFIVEPLTKLLESM